MNSSTYFCCNCELRFAEAIFYLDAPHGSPSPHCPRCKSPRVQVKEEAAKTSGTKKPVPQNREESYA